VSIKLLSSVPQAFEKVRSVANRLIRLPEVLRKTGLKQSTCYAEIKNGTFPKPVPLGVYAVAWIEDEVDAWVEKRIEARDSEEVKPLRRKYEKKKPAAAA
jgi:prophage regulatory protein